MLDRNCTETILSSDCRSEADSVAKALEKLSEKNQINLEGFLKAVDFLSPRKDKTA